MLCYIFFFLADILDHICWFISIVSGCNKAAYTCSSNFLFLSVVQMLYKFTFIYDFHGFLLSAAGKVDLGGGELIKPFNEALVSTRSV